MIDPDVMDRMREQDRRDADRAAADAKQRPRIDTEAKILEAFAAQGAADRQLAAFQRQGQALQEQANAVAYEKAVRKGYIDAQLERYEDEHGESFEVALRRPELAERYRRMQAGEAAPSPVLSKVE